MSRQMKSIFYSLILLVGILAFSTSFLFAKNRSINPKPSQEALGENTKKSAEPQTASTGSSQITKATASSDEPSHPENIYTIKSNETLFSIAQNHNITLAELSEINDIDDSDRIQEGQLLVIPDGGVVKYKVDTNQAQILQNQVDNNRTLWRVKPEETVRADGPVIFGLRIDDKYTLKDKDEANGTATVEAESANGRYLFTLVQPVTKGEKGVWAIESVKKIL